MFLKVDIDVACSITEPSPLYLCTLLFDEFIADEVILLHIYFVWIWFIGLGLGSRKILIAVVLLLPPLPLNPTGFRFN